MTTVNVYSPEFDGLKVAADWIRDLESSDSRLHKESVIEKALVAARLGSTSAQCFLFNAYLCYNPFYTYGVRQVPETNGLQDRANPWTEFWAMCEALRTRSLTGNAARARIAEVSDHFDSEQWNGLCRRVLIKDLRCGVSEKTLNKVLGKTDWKIPVFSCQLAQDSAEHPSKMKGAKRMEVKLDGVRVLALIDRNSVTLYSRAGKIFENFSGIEQELANIKRQLLSSTSGHFDKIVLDGEIVGKSFQQLMRQAHRKTEVDTSDSVYYIFDMIPFDDFERGFYNASQLKRTAWLEERKAMLESGPAIRVMPGVDVDLDTSEGHDIMRRFANDAVANGFEGIMIKDVTAPYECRRSSFWMKWKPTITVDLTVIAREPGTGRNKGRLGALVCEGVDNGKTIKVNVGSGFSDSDRTDYWISDNIVGHVVEVEADAVTQNQDGTYSLRFPRFVRFRGTEPGEKL